jgi:undecaprenyl-diphosphatase
MALGQADGQATAEPRGGRPIWRRAWPYLAWIAALALAVGVDGWAVDWVAGHRSPVLSVVAGFLRWFGQLHWEVGLALLLLVGGLWRRQRQVERTGLAGVLAWVIGTGLVQALKHAVGRERPYQADGFPFAFHALHNGFESFPSGDAAKAFCIAYVLQRLLAPAGWPMYILAALIAGERVYLGAHFPSDVIGAAAVGVLAGQIGVVLSRRIVRQEPHAETGNEAPPGRGATFAQADSTDRCEE